MKKQKKELIELIKSIRLDEIEVFRSKSELVEINSEQFARQDGFIHIKIDGHLKDKK